MKKFLSWLLAMIMVLTLMHVPTIYAEGEMQVAGTTTDPAVILKIDNKTLSLDNTWTIHVSSGTIKGIAGENLTGDLNLIELPIGLTYTAAKSDGNNIVITITGEVDAALTSDAVISAVVKGSAVTEEGALDSEAIALNLWVIGPGTTFVLTNEGGLIDKLIADGYGDACLYDVLVYLQASSGGIITDRFLQTLRSCPPDSEIFTAELSNFAGLNNPVCINSDGTVGIQPIYGRDLFGKTGYATYPENFGIGRDLFTYATSPQYYVNAGEQEVIEAGSTTYYKAFAIAWGLKTEQSIILSNENGESSTGGLIDKLIAAGHGSKNLYEVLQILKPNSNGVIADAFMAKLAACPVDSDIFTAELNNFSSMLNNPIGINADGNLIVAQINGRQYYGIDGFTTTETQHTGVSNVLFTQANNKENFTSAGTNVKDGVETFYAVFAIIWSPWGEVAGTATDSSVTMNIGNTTITSSDNTWEIKVETGTLDTSEGDDLTSDITVSGLLGGLTYVAEKGGENNIIITVAGTAVSQITAETMVSVVIKGSAVSDVGATESEVISVKVYPYALVEEATTFVLSNEEGGLIDELIAAGFGTSNLWQTLVGLAPSSNGVISDEFMDTLAMCPAGSEIFTAKLSNFAGFNNPVCINSDGTLTINPIFGRDYYGQTGYATYPENYLGREMFTYATSPQYYIDAGASGDTTRYKAFGIAWSSDVVDPDISGDFTDPNFKQAVWEWLGNPIDSTPSSFTKQNLIDRVPQIVWPINSHLDVDNCNIISLAGLEHFEGTGLRSFSCNSNNLTTLPTLPSSLQVLDCENNQLTNLPALPDGLNTLLCNRNQLTSLPVLPGSLQGLHCDGNQLTTIPALPDSIFELHCDRNQLSSLPNLPDRLQSLWCAENQITNLPDLPDSLLELWCFNNKLSVLPDLPDNLQALWCNGNYLTSLPNLPESLTIALTCENNYLNVFNNPLLTVINNCSAGIKTSTPQYRFIYTGTDIAINIGESRLLLGNNLQRQTSTNGNDWTNDIVGDMSEFTFTSANSAVASVTTNGLISAEGVGNCNIYADFTGVNSLFTRVIIPVNVSGSITNEALTFVLSNEEGGLIDDLIAAGYGNGSLYNALLALQSSSGGIISDEFLDNLAACPAGSEIFTAELRNFASVNNNPVCINSDGTLTVNAIYGRDYFDKTGYATYPEGPGGNELFTYATNPMYYIDAGSSGSSSDGAGSTKYYKAFAIAWSTVDPEVTLQVAGTATDATSILKMGDQELSLDNSWKINVTSGTVKGVAGEDITDSVILNGLPTGLTYTATKDGANNISITLSGEANAALTADVVVSAIIKGSAVTEIGAKDSEAIALDLWYIGPGTTLILSNEDGANSGGGLIDQLIAAGYKDECLYDVLVALQPHSGGVISIRFLKILSSCPSDSEIFDDTEAALRNTATPGNNPIGINVDGSLIIAPLYGRDYYGENGYATFIDNSAELNNAFFTYATDPQYFIDAGTSQTPTISPTTNYGVFAIIWEANLPTVTTTSLDLEDITSVSAKLSGSVVTDNALPITERGFVYSKTLNPTLVSGTKLTAGSGSGIFAASLSGLTAETTYHVRAYAINDAGTAYGEDRSFTTRELTNQDESGGNHHNDQNIKPDTTATLPDEQLPLGSLLFTDVAGHWAEDEIYDLVRKGIIYGYDDNTFRPDSTITRGEFADMLVKAFDLEPRQDKTFADITGHPAQDSIETAASYGIVKGYNERTFGPDDLIQREQMAAMIARAMKKIASTEAGLIFIDAATISGWAKQDVDAVVEEVWMIGYPDSTFRPHGNTTRAEAVRVIYNILK